MEEIRKVVIIGSGPAGNTAAIYACRAGLNPVLVTGNQLGGQLTTTPEIENWPGRNDNPDGISLMQSLQKHATDLGTEFIYESVEKAKLKGTEKVLTLSGGNEIRAKSIIICTGASVRYLGLESEEQYKGHGVSACATCDGFFFRNKDVAVVGGGSAAFVEALYLAGLCNKVYLIHRSDSFRAENALVKRLTELSKTGKVEFILNANVDSIIGDGNKVTGIRVVTTTGLSTVDVDGVFVAIGHNANTQVFEGQLELYSDGVIKTGFTTQTSTSVKGVFAAGDCADRVYKQAITSAGSGCMAALDAEHYLQELS